MPITILATENDEAIGLDGKGPELTIDIASVTQLLALTPASGPWRKKLADTSIKWSANNGECPTGDPALHQYIGELYYKGESSVSQSV